MNVATSDARAKWTGMELDSDRRWIFALDAGGRRAMLDGFKRGRDPAKGFLDYKRADFDFGEAWRVISRALDETKRGRGVALVKGLPREELDEQDFQLLTWAIGLHAGVARPQGKASHYISAVRDAGTAYRTGTGRGYSSNAELDFHTDSADIVFLSCYNKAASGGMSITTSSLAAYERMAEEHPDLVEYLHQPIHFSRQGEEAPDEAPSYPHPIFDHVDGQLFSKWNRNRVSSAQKIPASPSSPSSIERRSSASMRSSAVPTSRIPCGWSRVTCRSSTVT